MTNSRRTVLLKKSRKKSLYTFYFIIIYAYFPNFVIENRNVFPLNRTKFQSRALFIRLRLNHINIYFICFTGNSLPPICTENVRLIMNMSCPYHIVEYRTRRVSNFINSTLK